MSLFHFHVTQIKRSTGQSAVACAAYRAGEKLRSEYYGEVNDYTRKGGVVESGIMLPEYVPQIFQTEKLFGTKLKKSKKVKKLSLLTVLILLCRMNLQWKKTFHLQRNLYGSSLLNVG